MDYIDQGAWRDARLRRIELSRHRLVSLLESIESNYWAIGVEVGLVALVSLVDSVDVAVDLQHIVVIKVRL